MNNTLMICVLTLFLGALAFIGLKATQKTKTAHDFVIAGRSLGPLVIAITIVSTYGSASSYLGIGGLTFKAGWPAQWIWVGCLPGIILPILLLGPKMRILSTKLNAVTIPDFLGERYESTFLRVFVSLGIVAFYIPMMVAQFKGVGVLFETILNIPFTTATLIFGIIIILYCAAGGLFAVAWTDTLQGLFMAVIMLLLIPICLKNVGGWAEMSSRLHAIDPSLNSVFNDMYTPQTAIYCIVFYCLLQMGQPFIGSRFFALKNVKDFKKVVFYVLIFTVIISSVVWGGVTARILFPDIRPDYAIPTILQNLFPPFLGTVAVIGILAAMMTTIDALLITVGTAVGYDLFKKVINKKASDKQILRVTQLSTMAAGVIALVFALYKSPEFLSILVFAALGGMAAMIVGPVLVGVFDKKATKEAAIISSIAGEIIFLSLMNTFSIWKTGSIAMVSSIVLTIILSRIIGKPSEKINKIVFGNANGN